MRRGLPVADERPVDVDVNVFHLAAITDRVCNYVKGRLVRRRDRLPVAPVEVRTAATDAMEPDPVAVEMANFKARWAETQPPAAE